MRIANATYRTAFADKIDMQGYIRRKYNVPDYREIVIKQGFITVDEFIVKRKLTSQAASAVEKMNKLIDDANEKINDLLHEWETDEDLQARDSDWLHDQVIHMKDGMYIKLTDAAKITFG